MPALPGDVSLTGKQAERIFEAVAQKGDVSYAQLKMVAGQLLLEVPVETPPAFSVSVFWKMKRP